ncbi:MAG: putative MFS-type transporter [Pseudolabrys sp.]|nr:putative MFS-type transporter [Pseudolabrys sp.]
MEAPARLPSANQHVVIAALGVATILAWGTSFYFPAVFAGPIVRDTQWSFEVVVSGTSVGLLVAGLAAPAVGRLINRYGGRPILLASSLLYAVGLSGVGLAPSSLFYLGSWAVVGLGMGCGLYDAVFAVLGRMYGRAARGPITNLTLVGGFSSTICWPLSALLIDAFGWRAACLIYAGLHLCVSLPLQYAVVRRRQSGHEDEQRDRTVVSGGVHPIPHERPIMILIGTIMSVATAVGAVVIVNMMTLLQARGETFAAAVALATLFGPAQVGARVFEFLFGKRYHPIYTLAASCILMALGLLLLWLAVPVLALVILCYGGGYGICWIARGTLPLALFGPSRFPVLIGRLAFPSLVSQALAPSLGAWLITAAGANTTIAVLTLAAVLNVVLVAMLWAVCRPHVLVASC